MIIITDAHLTQASGSRIDFFRMLAAIEHSDHDIVFLGDVFDLWIALPRYEQEIHRRFLDWCQTQKSRRQIGFIEGNHEFFVAEERETYFSWCTGGAWRCHSDAVMFTHGDCVNPLDKNYLRFRKLTKNKTTKFLMRFFPFGPALTHALKLQLRRTNQRFRNQLPHDEIHEFAAASFLNGISTIFVGHFHCDYRYDHSDSQTLYAVPDWHTSQTVTVFDPGMHRVESLLWTDLNQIKT